MSIDPSSAVARSDNSTSAAQPRTSIGQVLAAHRLRQGMTQDDVAAALKYSRRQIEALENDDFAHLPTQTFLIGFVRNYARLLQVPAEPLVEALRHLPTQVEPPASRLHTAPPLLRPVLGERRRLTGIVLVAAILIIALIGVLANLFATISQSHSSADSVTAASTAPSTSGALSTAQTKSLALPPGSTPGLPDTPATPADAAGQKPPVTTAPHPEGSARALAAVPSTVSVQPPEAKTPPETNPSASGKPQPSATDRDKAKLAAIPAPTPAAPATSVAPPDAASTPPASPIFETTTQNAITEVSLQLRFVAQAEESWVGVTDANGQSLLNTVIPAGESRQVQRGALPLQVTVGSSTSMQVYYQNQAFDTRPYTRNNVARFKLK